MVLARAEQEFREAGKLEQFQQLRPFLIAGAGEETYAELGAKLGMSREAVKKAQWVGYKPERRCAIEASNAKIMERTNLKAARAAALALRLALAAGFLSALADRFGLWGKPGSPGVAWGD